MTADISWRDTCLLSTICGTSVCQLMHQQNKGHRRLLKKPRQESIMLRSPKSLKTKYSLGFRLIINDAEVEAKLHALFAIGALTLNLHSAVKIKEAKVWAQC